MRFDSKSAPCHLKCTVDRRILYLGSFLLCMCFAILGVSLGVLDLGREQWTKRSDAILAECQLSQSALELVAVILRYTKQHVQHHVITGILLSKQGDLDSKVFIRLGHLSNASVHVTKAKASLHQQHWELEYCNISLKISPTLNIDRFIHLFSAGLCHIR